jgi:hypothetical protein
MTQRYIAFDCDLRRPGCVLLQAGMGGDTRFIHLFPTETWLLAPTPGLRLYPVNEDQIQQLVDMAVKTVEEQP